MSWNWTLYNTLRTYDLAVYNWMADLLVDYGSISGKALPTHEILRVFATPEIAFATMADILIRKGWIQRDTPEQQLTAAEAYRITPLPFASIYRDDPVQDLSYAGVPLMWRGFTYNPETGRYENHPYPGAYKMNYQIDFWCLKKYTEAHIEEWIMSKLGKVGAAPNEFFLSVDHGLPWGTKIHGVKLDSFVDNSDLEPIDAEHRYLRHTATFTANVMLFRPPEEGPKPVFRINMNYRDARTIDGKTDVSGQDLETISTAKHPVVEGTMPIEFVINFYEHSEGVRMHKSILSSDGRIDPFRRTSSTGIYGTYEVHFPTGDSYIKQESLKLMDGRNYFCLRFRYLAPHEECYFALTNGSGVDIQWWRLPRTKKWKQFECFCVTEGNIGIRWGKNVANEARLNLDYISIEFQSLGESISPSSDSVVGGQRVVTFNGLNRNKPYLISGELLNATFDYAILVGDAGANPLLTTRIETVSGKWSNFAAVSQPSDTGSVKVVLDTNPSEIPSVEAREFFGFLKGNFTIV